MLTHRTAHGRGTPDPLTVITTARATGLIRRKLRRRAQTRTSGGAIGLRLRKRPQTTAATHAIITLTTDRTRSLRRRPAQRGARLSRRRVPSEVSLVDKRGRATRRDIQALTRIVT